jgi:hypothetical protein
LLIHLLSFTLPYNDEIATPFDDAIELSYCLFIIRSFTFDKYTYNTSTTFTRVMDIINY